MRRLVILSGAPGSGKSTSCARLVEAAQRRGLACGGLLSPARFQGDAKVGIDVVDLRSGQRRPLAEVIGSFEPHQPHEAGGAGEVSAAGLGQGGSGEGHAPSGPRLGRYQFDQGAIGWAAARLRDACPCTLLVVDELGPLELERQAGWADAVRILQGGRYRLAVVTVRPSLVPAMRAVLGALPDTEVLEERLAPGRDPLTPLLDPG